jgi:flagellin
MYQNESIYIGTMTSRSLGLTTDQGAINLNDVESANQAIGTLDSALKQVSRLRADLGGFQNRFETAKVGIDVASENLQAAESRIRDTDMASEIVKYTRDQLLNQSGLAMLAQANSQSASVLQLLG